MSSQDTGRVADATVGAGGTVVVAVDGSAAGDRALSMAFDVAGGLGARVLAVMVAKLVAPTGELLGASGAILQAADDLAGSLRQALVAESGRTGVGAELVVRRGAVLNEIVAVADERSARMVLVGASTSFGHRLIGALAPRLVRVAHWPVVVVP